MDYRAWGGILAMVLLLLPARSFAAVNTLPAAFMAPGVGIPQQPAANQSVCPQQPPTQQQAAQSQSAGSTPASPDSAMHCITVQFDYDFSKTPACSAKVKTVCVQKFSVYDISGGKPYFLFSVPLPQNTEGLVKGITATSPRLLFAVGKHRIGVAAQMPDGQESKPRDCRVIIEIKPDAPPPPAASSAPH